MIKTEVLRRDKPRFSMVGQKLPDTLLSTDEEISPGLAYRISRYATGRLTESGFDLEGWSCRVTTSDGDRPRGERVYHAEFIHSKGGMVGIQGIFIGAGGWPCIDHGLCIGEGETK
ncbi:hypothetical protein EV128_12595 [Rhizobium azibense]|nr:hypothetical protein EV128_12595 [Rhizobium azibense]